MSVKIEARANTLGGRTMITAAMAGLVGVAITLAVAASLLLGRPSTTQQVTAPAFRIEPGYVDYAQRHRAQSAPALGIGEPDYWQRLRVNSAPALGVGEPDYWQRHPELP